MVLEQGPVDPPSTQRAELNALVQCLKLVEGHNVNIYTDSAFVYHVVHRDLGAWQRNNWTTATGGKPRHLDLLQELAQVINTPKSVAVVKVPGLSKEGYWQAKGNNAADQAAKAAEGLLVAMLAVTTQDERLDAVRLQSIQDWGDTQVKRSRNCGKKEELRAPWNRTHTCGEGQRDNL